MKKNIYLTFLILVIAAIGITKLPLSKDEEKEISLFNEKLNDCNTNKKSLLKQSFRLNTFSYAKNVFYLGYDLSERWKSFNGLPLHLKLFATIEMLGKKNEFIVFFTKIGVAYIFPIHDCFFIKNLSRETMHWEKKDEIEMFNVIVKSAESRKN